MRLQLTFIFFVIFGTENTSPALLGLGDNHHLLALGPLLGCRLRGSLVRGRPAKVSISKNISMVNDLYLTD